MTALSLTRRPRPSPLLLGGAVLALVVAACLVGSVGTPYDPAAVAVRVRLQPRSAAHWVGTDEVWA